MKRLHLKDAIERQGFQAAIDGINGLKLSEPRKVDVLRFIDTALEAEWMMGYKPGMVTGGHYRPFYYSIIQANDAYHAMATAASHYREQTLNCYREQAKHGRGMARKQRQIKALSRQLAQLNADPDGQVQCGRTEQETQPPQGRCPDIQRAEGEGMPATDKL